MVTKLDRLAIGGGMANTCFACISQGALGRLVKIIRLGRTDSARKRRYILSARKAGWNLLPVDA